MQSPLGHARAPSAILSMYNVPHPMSLKFSNGLRSVDLVLHYIIGNVTIAVGYAKAQTQTLKVAGTGHRGCVSWRWLLLDTGNSSVLMFPSVPSTSRCTLDVSDTLSRVTARGLVWDTGDCQSVRIRWKHIETAVSASVHISHTFRRYLADNYINKTESKVKWAECRTVNATWKLICNLFI